MTYRSRLYMALILIMFGLVVANILISPVKAEEFTDALNQERRARGLRAVEYDPRLDKIAAANNALQATYGQGHHFTGGHGQCCYVGPITKIGALFGFVSGVLRGPGYIDSPSHAAILFHPGAKRIGVSQNENCNTVVIAFDESSGSAPAPTTTSLGVTTPCTGAGCSTTYPPPERIQPWPARGIGRRGFGRLRWRLNVGLTIGNY